MTTHKLVPDDKDILERFNKWTLLLDQDGANEFWRDVEWLRNPAAPVDDGVLVEPVALVERCKSCDGTGDLVRADGAYLGKCPLCATALSRSTVLEEAAKKLKAEDVEWVVNSIAELGVKIGNQFFFMYKGRSLAYDNPEDEHEEPLQWRPVGMREFGECCHPVNYEDLRKCGQPHYIGTVNLGDSDDWQPLPAPPAIRAAKGE